jgi:16S rRNA (guanine527-N7)-methyltransferase
MNSKDVKYLNDKLTEWDLSLSEKQKTQFFVYFELLVERNSVMNLTGITDFYEVMDKHFLDSISMCKAISLNENSDYHLIDVGTGAGFPGVPLKIMFPSLKVTLLDSLLKRINFLDEVVTKLELENVELIHGRAEDYGKLDVYRETFDIATSRAVANLSSLSEICLPFVKKDGVFISYKSEKLEDELESSEQVLALLGGKINKQESFFLPETDLFRNLLVIGKVDLTPSKYPRKAGIPFKRPLS